MWIYIYINLIKYIYYYIHIVMLLQAKSKLQLRLTHNEHLVAPRERVEPRSPEVSPEAVAAMAKRLVERTRKDLEAQMAVTWKFPEISRYVNVMVYH